MKLSILMPAYNEATTIGLAIKRVLGVCYPCDVELVVVDDGSRDHTSEVLSAIDDPRLIVGRHRDNRGKGAAVRTAATMATGDYLVVFDADLEYRPEDLLNLFAPIQRGDAQVVYGVRTFGASTAHSFWFVIGNRVNTFTANALFNTWISDLHSCLKLMPAPLFRQLPVRENGFGLDTEITAHLLARGYRPYEVPISYKARSREEGKKLTWGDGVDATWILVRVRVREGIRNRRARKRPGEQAAPPAARIARLPSGQAGSDSDSPNSPCGSVHQDRSAKPAAASSRCTPARRNLADTSVRISSPSANPTVRPIAGSRTC
jgi:dolichol-phosphate hexosyltransferase